MSVSAMYIPEIPPPTTTTSQDMGRNEDPLKHKQTKKWVGIYN